jgi:hypothetical protein
MLWIALAFIVAMMIGFLMPRKPLSLNLSAKKSLPPRAQDPFAPPTDDTTSKNDPGPPRS